MEYKKVYSIYRQDELAWIKTVLQARNIDFHITNETTTRTSYPLGISMDVMVPEDQAEEAEKIINDAIK